MLHVLRISVVLAYALVGATNVVAQAPKVPEQIAQLLQDRDYDEAIKAIDAAKNDKELPQDYLAYLKGRALHFQKNYNEAIAVFDQLLKVHPDSRWARRARFANGVSYARKGSYREAELIYKAEAQQLLSLERKQEIADIYLEFADAYFKPDDENKKPDYNKAKDFFLRALLVGPKPEKKAEIELLVAQCFQELGDYATAVTRLEKFVKDYKDDQRVVEARFRLGDSQLAAGHLDDARRTWKDLLQLHGESQSERLPEAAYKISLTYNIPSPNDKDELTLGVTALRSFIKQYPDHKLASEAHLRIAQSYLNFGRLEDAFAALTQFLAEERYANAEEVPDARYLLGYALKMQKNFDDAIGTWNDFLIKHPTHKLWTSAQREIINTEFLTGYVKFQEKQYDPARELWTKFLNRYPLDQRSRSILYHFGQMNYAQEKWDEAIQDWRRLVSKYPNTEEASHAQFMIAVTLEEKLVKFEDALKEYRKLTWGSHQSQAQQRIGRLTAKRMSIVTERVFRSQETPRIKLTCRNLESVTVRVYTVDLETYFRKMHLARGVEGLDIALIDPDETFEFAVPDYEKYRETECAVEVPLPTRDADEEEAEAAGVMAVTVSSKTLEATTLVLQSNLDLIVKSSRDEVFVFAENMRTGAPWSKARVLISDGKNVFAEGETNDNGVLHQAYEELESAADVRVFAVADGHVASNVVGLQGIGVSRGLTARGYIYTERPAYRPGQMVHVRGVVRQVDGDTYKVASGKEYRVEVLDNRNRLVHEASVKLNDFGSFHTHCMLPSSSPQGQYRVLVSDDDKETYQGTFLVQEYQLEPVRLEVDTERTVYYRGEEIEGTIKASYYYGAPLVGKEIRYRLQNGAVTTAKTDQRGEVQFAVPTREFRETQPLVMQVTLPERNLQIGKTFFLSTFGFTLSTETVRSVYLAGETFELTVKAVDAEGNGVAEDLELHVLEKTSVNGQVGEVQVEQHALKTGEDGVAAQTLKLEKGGDFVLRVEGLDRFENPVSAETRLRISDDKDEERLRILADRHTYQVGEAAKVQLHWREEPALGLVTFQGARILEYKLVQLQKGSNELEIPMTAKLAPNFHLEVAVMTDVRENVQPGPATRRRFHTASSHFTVERDLRVELAVKRKPDAQGQPAPGEDIEVSITSTDPQGKPVSAELSLALVEQTLLDRFSSPLAAIGDFFRGALRKPDVRTTASITFEYRPATQPINLRLLAEEERLELMADEESRLAALHGPDAVGDNEAVNGDGLIASPLVMSVDPSIELSIRGDVFDFSEHGVPNVDHLNGLSGGGLGGTSVSGRWSGLQSGNGAHSFGGQAGHHLFGTTSETGEELRATAGNSGGGNAVTFDNDGDSLHWFFEQQAGVQVLQGNGVWSNVNFNNQMDGQWDADRAHELAERLTEQGAVLLPHLHPHETGYWNPAITTDAQGEATVTITLPDRSTAWTLLAKGITADTLAGEASNQIAVKKDLFGELKLPLAFTDGDSAAITASVHNQAVEKGKIEVTLKTTIGEKTVTERQTLDDAQAGITQLSFQRNLELPRDAVKLGDPTMSIEFELTVVAGERRDVVRRSVPLHPYGMPVYSIASGAADGDVTAIVGQPKGMTLTAPRLQIILGPTIQRSLLDAVLAPATWCQVESARLASDADSAASDLMASLALQKLVGQSREQAGPQTAALDARVRSAITLLVSLQNEDGGWAWAGQQSASERFSTARVVWALSLARQAGYRVDDDSFNKAINLLRTEITKSRVADYETKTVLLHALAEADRGDFTLANQLYRNRQSLSPAGIAHLALTFAAMDRKQTAAELLNLLSEETAALAQPVADNSGLAWNHSDVELRALFALGLENAGPDQNGRLKTQIDWLMAHRTGHRWSPDKATGPAMLALCRWFADAQFEGEKYKLTIFVNNVLAQEVDVDQDSRTQTIDIPAELLNEDKQAVRFHLDGRGKFTYQCVLGGYVPGDKLASTTQDWKVVRYHEPAPKELDGHEIPRGFNVLKGEYSTFRNELNELPVGRRGHVELRITRQDAPASTPDEQLDYIVVTEPLPAGVSVVESSVNGGFERFEISPGTITFYVGSRRKIAPIHYEIHGYAPGTYRASPTLVRDAYRPDQIAVAQPKPLKVLPLGEESRDKYRLTPRELYELGERHFDKGDFAASATHLSELFQNWNLADKIFKDTVVMLMQSHLKTGPAKDVVRYFEIVIEKYPSHEISFDDFLRIGDAYHEIGEYERSYLVFRATVEASFVRESLVAGFLQQQGEFLRSVDVMNKLLGEYPPESYLVTATYALAQRIYGYAPSAANDTKLREAKVTRIDLIQQARDMLDAFLTAHPDDPAADQGAFSLANALLELELFDDTIAACSRYADRYQESDYLDSFWYITGYCHYALGQHEQALAMCRKVSEHQRKDKNSGRLVESPNKWRSIYILGQIHHSLGEAERAIDEYERVKDRFADARQAIDYFAHKQIKLPESTTFKPDEDINVELDFRNVAACEATVYRIDLMKFSLLNRNLGGITKINLAGIRPFHEATIELGDGKDYQDRSTTIPLPLIKEGAYLVVCRGENLHTSGLVLITPLVVEVQEDAVSGRVRTTVRDTAKSRYVNDVHVKVIGSHNEDFTSGDTDLRGVFVADGITGRSMVIAQADGGRYAFFRGQTDLGAVTGGRPRGGGIAQPAEPTDGTSAAEDLLEGVMGSNKKIQMDQQQELDDLFQGKGGAEEGGAGFGGFGGGFGGGIF